MGVFAGKRRELDGEVVEHEYFHRALTRLRDAQRRRRSPSALDLVAPVKRDPVSGDSVSGDSVDGHALDGNEDAATMPMKRRSIQGSRDRPDLLLTYIIEGNLAGIDAMGDQELSPGLRRLIVAGLARVDAEDLEGNREDLLAE